MKRATALDESELEQLLLRLAPQFQQDQYELDKGIIPLSLRLTLDKLVTIEKTDIQVPKKTKKAAKQGNQNRKRNGTQQDRNQHNSF